MTVSVDASGAAPVAPTDTEPYEAFADGRLWRRLRTVSIFLLGAVGVQMINWLLRPNEFSRLKVAILLVTLVVYSIGLLWYHRTATRVRRKPVLRIDASGLGVQAPEAMSMRSIRWDEIDGVAWRGIDEVGVRLKTADGEIAEVVSVPTAQLPEEAADRLCSAIAART